MTAVRTACPRHQRAFGAEFYRVSAAARALSRREPGTQGYARGLEELEHAKRSVEDLKAIAATCEACTEATR